MSKQAKQLAGLCHVHVHVIGGGGSGSASLIARNFAKLW